MESKIRTYRWLVLALGSVCSGMSVGLLYSVGVLYKDWVNSFDAHASFISFAGGSAAAVACLSGPIYGILVRKLGMRKCCFAGGIIMTLGMATSSVVTTVVELCFTFGVLAGFGAGLCYYAASTLINDYFVHQRMLAEGVMGGGLCGGTFIFSLVQQYLSSSYTWKGSMLITGAICLHLSLWAMFFIPFNKIDFSSLNFWKSSDSKNQTQESKEENVKKTHFKDDELKQTEDSFCEPSDVVDKEESISSAGFFSKSIVLFRNPVFILILATDFLSWLAIFIPYVHLVERGKQEGLDENTSAWLSSMIGLAGTVGRPFTGMICSCLHFHPFWSYCVVQMLCGITIFISSFWSNVYGLFTFAVLFGFLGNGYGFIKASAALMLDPSRYAEAFSWMLLLEGSGVFLGPTLAGFLYERTKSYNWSFRFSGCLLIVAASICFLKSAAEKLDVKVNSRNPRKPMFELTQAVA